MSHYDDLEEKNQEKVFEDYYCKVMKSHEELNSNVQHPEHYNKHPSGVECIDVIKHMGWCLGSAIKYIWRADHKNDAIEDLEKAIFCIEQEIKKRRESNE